ncbi:hypothetical protein ACFZAB_03795 [Streptomyces albogriseolus]|uniref:hypothetical protein n=1 Tax=Streptomyces albogriseolus TaxID=1887 RepID=UPI0036EC5FC2
MSVSKSSCFAELGTGPYPGEKATREKTEAACRAAHDEALLMRHLVRAVRERHGVADERLAQVVDIDPADVWKRVADETGDLSDVLDAAERVATVDGDLDSHEKAVLAELRERCRRG